MTSNLFLKKDEIMSDETDSAYNSSDSNSNSGDDSQESGEIIVHLKQRIHPVTGRGNKQGNMKRKKKPCGYGCHSKFNDFEEKSKHENEVHWCGVCKDMIRFTPKRTINMQSHNQQFEHTENLNEIQNLNVEEKSTPETIQVEEISISGRRIEINDTEQTNHEHTLNVEEISTPDPLLISTPETNQVSERRTEINDTEESNRENQQQMYRCGNGCDRAFSHMEDFAKHFTQYHERMKCPLCPKTFINQYELTLHLSYNHVAECLTCKPSLPFPNVHALQMHDRDVHQKVKLTCQTCGSEFSHAGEFEFHVKTHLEEKKIPCMKCDKRFQLQESLEQHWKAVHEDRHYKCELCTRKFKSLFFKTQHFREFHDGKKVTDFYCEYCFLQFPKKRALTKHIKNEHRDVYGKPNVIP